MIDFSISTSNVVTPKDLLQNIPMFQHTLLQNIKSNLDTVKSQIDKVCPERFAKISSATNSFSHIKKHIANVYSAQHPTNAFLKLYEILQTYKLIENAMIYTQNKNTTVFTTFHNAEFPGSFLMCTQYYISTQMKNVSLDWKMSSLFDSNPEAYIQDVYCLHQNYTDRFVHGNTNGDVTNIQFIEHLERTFENSKVMMYTSDLGFSVIGEYNNQEILHSHHLLGQIVCGIVCLQQGGSFVVKCYTAFEMFTIHCILVTAKMFKQFKIVKPMTSRPCNSEMYIIGIGFKHPGNDILKYLKSRVEKFSLQPMMSFEKTFKYMYIELCQLVQAQMYISFIQSIKINEIIMLNEKYKDINDIHELFTLVKKEMSWERNKDVQSFFKKYTFQKLLPIYFLNVN